MSSRVLLDMEANPAIAKQIRQRIEGDADHRVVDLHLWQVGTGHLALIVSLATHYPRPPAHYRSLLGEVAADTLVQGTRYSRYDIIPSEVDLAGAEVDLARTDSYLHALKSALEAMMRGY